MHRAQILLEDWQYQSLRARAEREGRSMSDLVREIVSAAITPPRGTGALHAIAGVGEDRGAYGRDHDRLLYGEPDAGAD